MEAKKIFNEYSLLKIMSAYFNSGVNEAFKIETGDDAAVRVCHEGEQLIYTADVLVENIHFSLDYMSFEEVGYKSIVASVSDCAAMGADVDSVVIQLTFPKNCNSVEDDIISIYKGVEKACKQWDFPVVGGDLSSGSCWSIAVSLTGKVEKNKRVLLRTGAKVGDGVWITGEPGRSAAGLEILRIFGRDNISENKKLFLDAHIAPTARIKTGKKLAADSTVTTLTDISDGVAKETRTLAYENSLGVELRVDSLPIFSKIKDVAQELTKNFLDWFLFGGEDYELLFTASDNFDKSNYEIPLTKIGVVTDGVGVTMLMPDGSLENINSGGWDHFIK